MVEKLDGPICAPFEEEQGALFLVRGEGSWYKIGGGSWIHDNEFECRMFPAAVAIRSSMFNVKF